MGMKSFHHHKINIFQVKKEKKKSEYKNKNGKASELDNFLV